MSEWIDVRERLPGRDEGDAVLVVREYLILTPKKRLASEVIIASYGPDGRWTDFDGWNISVTHWMPLPELPPDTPTEDRE